MLEGYLLILRAAIGQQNVVSTRDGCLKVSVCWAGKEAQSYKQGTFIRNEIQGSKPAYQAFRLTLTSLVDSWLRLVTEQSISVSRHELPR
jgi:hypothetical protein